MLAALKLLSLLPLPLLYGIANLLFVPLYRISGYRRKTVQKNLARAFPELSSDERAQIERDFYRFLCDNFAEIVHAYRISPKALDRRVELVNIEELNRHFESDQSVLLLLLHQGNWEWALQSLSIHSAVPFAGVYKPLHSKVMDQFILETRSRYGGTAVPFKNTMKDLLRNRRKQRCLAMAADQAPISREKRYWTNFLGGPAPFYYGPQVIAQATNTPVVFMQVHRVKRGYYRVSFETLATPPYEKDSVELLNTYIDRSERAIRAQPETWLWSNRKWKTPKSWEREEVEKLSN